MGSAKGPKASGGGLSRGVIGGRANFRAVVAVRKNPLPTVIRSVLSAGASEAFNRAPVRWICPEMFALTRFGRLLQVLRSCRPCSHWVVRGFERGERAVRQVEVGQVGSGEDDRFVARAIVERQRRFGAHVAQVRFADDVSAAQPQAPRADFLGALSSQQVSDDHTSTRRSGSVETSSNPPDSVVSTSRRSMSVGTSTARVIRGLTKLDLGFSLCRRDRVRPDEHGQRHGTGTGKKTPSRCHTARAS